MRGAYTGALAKELRKANGKIDISQMHTNAAKEVKKRRAEQIPELRDTLTKRLILPGSAFFSEVSNSTLYYINE